MSKAFELGKSYKTQAGASVTIIKVNDQRGYETVQGDDMGPDTGFRYNRASDRGRCTGSAFDMSDPNNLIPEADDGPDQSNYGL